MHRPAAWRLIIPSDEVPDLVPGGSNAATGTIDQCARRRRVVLHLPAYEAGTGNFNRELLHAWANDPWHDVDVAAWHDELDRRLPKGLVILKGVYPHDEMTAETPVWRQQDGPREPGQAGQREPTPRSDRSDPETVSNPVPSQAKSMEPWDAPPKY
jgi:hypothetical protein